MRRGVAHGMMSPHDDRLGRQASAQLLGIADHPVDLGHRREACRVDLRRASGHDDLAPRPLAPRRGGSPRASRLTASLVTAQLLTTTVSRSPSSARIVSLSAMFSRQPRRDDLGPRERDAMAARSRRHRLTKSTTAADGSLVGAQAGPGRSGLVISARPEKLPASRSLGAAARRASVGDAASDGRTE